MLQTLLSMSKISFLKNSLISQFDDIFEINNLFHGIREKLLYYIIFSQSFLQQQFQEQTKFNYMAFILNLLIFCELSQNKVLT